MIVVVCGGGKRRGSVAMLCSRVYEVYMFKGVCVVFKNHFGCAQRADVVVKARCYVCGLWCDVGHFQHKYNL